MHLFSPWFVLIAPLALVIVAFIPKGFLGARRYANWAIAGSALSLGVSLASAAALIASGPLKSLTLGWAGVGLSIYIDTLSAIMLLLVSFVGLIVIRYSRNYLDGDPGHKTFTTWLLLTLASVLTLILSGNVVQLILAWIATSLALNKLLLFYHSDQPHSELRGKNLLSAALGMSALLAQRRSSTLTSQHSISVTLVRQQRPQPPQGHSQPCSRLPPVSSS